MPWERLQSGHLVANMPVPTALHPAFGLSMDYEVFLVSRIQGIWLESGRATHARRSVAKKRCTPPTTSVALGVARTDRVITAAALVMSMSFAALIAARVHAGCSASKHGFSRGCRRHTGTGWSWSQHSCM